MNSSRKKWLVGWLLLGALMVFAMVSTSIGTLTVLAALSELLKHRLIEKGAS